MKTWTYDEYLLAVNSSMDFGIESRGYNAGQAFGFAQTELALRMERFPSEAMFALTALIICGMRRGLDLASLQGNSFFVEELKNAYSSCPVSGALDPKFSADTEIVRERFLL